MSNITPSVMQQNSKSPSIIAPYELYRRTYRRRSQHLLNPKNQQKVGVARLASNATPAPESTAPSGSKRGGSNE